MSEDLLIGLAATAIPLVVLGFLLLRRSPVIFRFFMALLLVGLGYLGVTGALDDIGRIVKGEQEPLVAPAAAPVEPTPAPAPAEPPAAEPTPEPAPLPPAEAPVGEPAPPPVEATPEETAPDPESAPPPPETAPDGAVTPPEELPPANP